MSEPSALRKILAPGGIRPVFQPVVELGRGAASIHHLECLTRGPEGTNMEAANVLFEYVRLKREEIAVDRVCVAAALSQAGLFPPGTGFSVNVHASTLGRDAGFVEFLLQVIAQHNLQESQVSVEIVEHAPPWDNETFLRAVGDLRHHSIGIALDDVGLGQSNFKMILDVLPDFLKIDRYFIRSCHADPNRQAVIEAIRLLASRFGAEVIAEGVETAEEIRFLRSVGVSLFQGYFFGKAAAAADYEETAAQLPQAELTLGAALRGSV
jgi:EAL domain-containing protein (putative c-di-GMP-specific phosphodiesterase class I)